MDLAKWSSSAKPHLSADDVRSLMKQMVGAVGYLHRCRVVHRDIKPANILIDPVTLTLRIADFGLSRVIEVSDAEEHQGHHHRVWNFERPRAPSVDDDMGETSPPVADSFGSAQPLSRGDSGSFESDDSDVESDSPDLIARMSTPLVVTRWCIPSNFEIINHFAFVCRRVFLGTVHPKSACVAAFTVTPSTCGAWAAFLPSCCTACNPIFTHPCAFCSLAACAVQNSSLSTSNLLFTHPKCWPSTTPFWDRQRLMTSQNLPTWLVKLCTPELPSVRAKQRVKPLGSKRWKK
jgi:serine/threonine protein kinase